ncbi:hypothetical protein L596_019506 [Steinernema carpocapsae]|uniref:Uncharacterized protein n=1 Tax=Steinernema carpocapsae TaxID=34508 RepID=A0A4U5MQV6_STECR|nr:hypothetical protein L596_019506 [Steinernema carpocapsae]
MILMFRLPFSVLISVINQWLKTKFSIDTIVNVANRTMCPNVLSDNKRVRDHLCLGPLTSGKTRDLDVVSSN